MLVIIYLTSLSPLVSVPDLPRQPFAFPRHPRHIPPPSDSGRGVVRTAALPSPFLERKSATVICAPGLWTTLNLKGCKARYQQVILALVSFIRWSHWRGAWSEESEFPSQEIITEGEDGLPNLDRIWCFLLSEISQRAGELRIIRNKPSIISRQPQELSHLLFLSWDLSRPQSQPSYQFRDVPALDPSGSPDTVPPPAQLHTSVGSTAREAVRRWSGPGHTRF